MEQTRMSVIKEDWDLDENGVRYSWRYEYSSKTGLLTRMFDSKGEEYKHVAHYQYDSEERLKHIFSYSFDRISFPLIQKIHEEKGKNYSLEDEIISYETCHCYLDNRIIVGKGDMLYPQGVNRRGEKTKIPYTLWLMSPHYIKANWYLKRPDYLTKMIERYEEELKMQEEYPLRDNIQLSQVIRLSPAIYPDIPIIPQEFLDEVKEIFETMTGNLS